ncbi:hypothetical protein KEM52_002659 [Ascosphaera acerosa]|nr:hypothetical protein KEM52_002659 [Ascosphaera acerosa]
MAACKGDNEDVADDQLAILADSTARMQADCTREASALEVLLTHAEPARRLRVEQLLAAHDATRLRRRLPEQRAMSAETGGALAGLKDQLGRAQLAALNAQASSPAPLLEENIALSAVASNLRTELDCHRHHANDVQWQAACSENRALADRVSQLQTQLAAIEAALATARTDEGQRAAGEQELRERLAQLQAAVGRDGRTETRHPGPVSASEQVSGGTALESSGLPLPSAAVQDLPAAAESASEPRGSRRAAAGAAAATEIKVQGMSRQSSLATSRVRATQDNPSFATVDGGDVSTADATPGPDKPGPSWKGFDDGPPRPLFSMTPFLSRATTFFKHNVHGGDTDGDGDGDDEDEDGNDGKQRHEKRGSVSDKTDATAASAAKEWGARLASGATAAEGDRAGARTVGEPCGERTGSDVGEMEPTDTSGAAHA